MHTTTFNQIGFGSSFRGIFTLYNRALSPSSAKSPNPEQEAIWILKIVTVRSNDRPGRFAPKVFHQFGGRYFSLAFVKDHRVLTNW